MAIKPARTTTISPDDMTGEQLAHPSSQPRFATTQFGVVQGGTTKNGVAAFLNVPYAEPVLRWTQVKPLESSFRYAKEPYIVDGQYCAQPDRYYTSQIPVRQRLGLGKPTETPFFADIYVPSTVDLHQGQTPNPKLPVKVFLHGGFINFGSTSGSHYNQQFFAAEEFQEIRVLLGHRVSVWGFLASEKHGLEGNYGFRDCWTGLEWVRDNISAFAGDPSQIHLIGLSGGSHIVHQLIHYAARQAPQKAPFKSAFLQSNAILSDPVTAASKEPQLDALLKGVNIDADSLSAIDHLRDSSAISTEDIVHAVQNMGFHSIFRGVAGNGGWNSADQMGFQHSGELGRQLRIAGVEHVILGDVKDENAFYSIVHPCKSKDEMIINLERFYPPGDARKLLDTYLTTMPCETPEEWDKLQGQIFADGQVHLSCRILARDLLKGDMPVVRYAVEWVAKGLNSKGIISHGSDLPLHHYRLSILSPTEAEDALAFRRAIDQAVDLAKQDPRGSPQGDEMQVLTMKADGKTEWEADWRWKELRLAESALGLDRN